VRPVLVTVGAEGVGVLEEQLCLSSHHRSEEGLSNVWLKRDGGLESAPVVVASRIHERSQSRQHVSDALAIHRLISKAHARNVGTGV
jgi:hypothetical protein